MLWSSLNFTLNNEYQRSYLGLKDWNSSQNLIKEVDEESVKELQEYCWDDSTFQPPSEEPILPKSTIKEDAFSTIQPSKSFEHVFKRQYHSRAETYPSSFKLETHSSCDSSIDFKEQFYSNRKSTEETSPQENLSELVGNSKEWKNIQEVR